MDNDNIIQALQERITDWAESKFADKYSLNGTLEHLKEELEHLVGSPFDAENWADVFILFLSALHKAGFDTSDLYQATEAKVTINEFRQWREPDEHGVIRRDS